MAKIICHVVAAKGQHGEGIAPQHPGDPAAAAVVSDAQEDPRKTPCSQSKASLTSGMVAGRRPPNKIAERGTPFGFCQSGSMEGHCEAGAVKRELGWAAFRPEPGVHSRPSQSMARGGAGTPIPSHQTSPSGVRGDVSEYAVAGKRRDGVWIIFYRSIGRDTKTQSRGSSHKAVHPRRDESTRCRPRNGFRSFFPVGSI